MKNTFINQYKRLVRKHTLIVNYDNSELSTLLAQDSSRPDSEYNYKELLDTVEQLGFKQKTAFKMHYNGYPYKEIAEQMNLPIGTVKSRISIAKKSLSKQLITQLTYSK